MATKGKHRMPMRLPGQTPTPPSDPQPPPPLPVRRAPPPPPDSPVPSMENYDTFEPVVETPPPLHPYNPVDDTQQVYDACELGEDEDQDTYEAPDEPQAPPALPANNRRPSQPQPPPLPTQRDPPVKVVALPVLDIYEGTPEPDTEIYEECHDDELPQTPVRDKCKPAKPKPNVKNPGIKEKIEFKDILGAISRLKKTSIDLGTKPTINGSNKNEKDATNFNDRKKYFQENVNEQLDEGLNLKLTKNFKGFPDKIKVVSPTKENGRPLPPRPEVNDHDDRDLPPPPTDDQLLVPEDDSQEIYEECTSDPYISKFLWYHATIIRIEAEKRVKAVHKDGAFLVRNSTNSDDQPFTLVVLLEGRVNNLKVRLRADKRLALGNEKENEMSFKDLESMIEYHREHPVLLIGTQKGEITLGEIAKRPDF